MRAGGIFALCHSGGSFAFALRDGRCVWRFRDPTFPSWLPLSSVSSWLCAPDYMHCLHLYLCRSLAFSVRPCMCLPVCGGGRGRSPSVFLLLGVGPLCAPAPTHIPKIARPQRDPGLLVPSSPCCSPDQLFDPGAAFSLEALLLG